jgi:formiminoglutamase
MKRLRWYRCEKFHGGLKARRMMEPVVIYGREDLSDLIQVRAGEKKLGEVVAFLQRGEGLEALPHYSARGVRFVLLGIPESIGPMANYGKCCTEFGWRVFLDAFLNMQSNRFLTGESILCLGHVDTKDLGAAASSFSLVEPEPIKKLRNLCSRLDDIVWPILQSIAHAGLVPVVIGGGHNNAYPILKGLKESPQYGQGIQAVNCDPHADFRLLEGRHSGNAFSYAYKDGCLKRYFVFGLHENYNSEKVVTEIEENPDLDYSSFDTETDVRVHIQKAEAFLGEVDLPVGIEVDMDSIIDMPSSAMTPSGFRVEEVRRFVRTMASKFKTAYLHLAEGAPVLGTADEIRVGKTLSYLALDFMKCILSA